MAQRTRKLIYSVLEDASRQDAASRTINIALIALIIINVAAVILETVESLGTRYARAFYALEIISIARGEAQFYANGQRQIGRQPGTGNALLCAKHDVANAGRLSP